MNFVLIDGIVIRNLQYGYGDKMRQSISILNTQQGYKKRYVCLGSDRLASQKMAAIPRGAEVIIAGRLHKSKGAQVIILVRYIKMIAPQQVKKGFSLKYFVDPNALNDIDLEDDDADTDLSGLIFDDEKEENNE